MFDPIFFFSSRRRHTRSKRDWSSDVCSSDLEGLTNWLEGMQGTSSILLALILGAMFAVDMGGPFNKVAFLFGSAMIAEGNYGIMGPIAVAIAIPPLGMGLATFLKKKKY